MKFRKTLLALGLTCAFGSGIMAEEAAAPKPKFSREELSSDAFTDKLSQAYGHLIQKSLDNPVLKLKLDQVIKGMQAGNAGKPSPMSEEEYEEAINAIQENAYQELSAKNLKEAEEFLKDNKSKKGVIDLEPGKLQVIVVEEGNGKSLAADAIAEIKYKGQYVNNQVFGSSDDAGGPISLSLSQTIPGFRQGLLGMKEGEKRRLFIHPDLGYGTSGQLMPNALLIFDVELVKVKEKPDAKEGLLSDASDEDIDAPGHPVMQEDEEDYEDHDVNADMNR